MRDAIRVVAQLIEHQRIWLESDAPVHHQDDKFQIV
jgi:hypothetical protein